eukprot:5454130-Amphidinium_carterae.1
MQIIWRAHENTHLVSLLPTSSAYSALSQLHDCLMWFVWVVVVLLLIVQFCVLGRSCWHASIEAIFSTRHARGAQRIVG